MSYCYCGLHVCYCTLESLGLWWDLLDVKQKNRSTGAKWEVSSREIRVLRRQEGCISHKWPFKGKCNHVYLSKLCS